MASPKSQSSPMKSNPWTSLPPGLDLKHSPAAPVASKSSRVNGTDSLAPEIICTMDLIPEQQKSLALARDKSLQLQSKSWDTLSPDHCPVYPTPDINSSLPLIRLESKMQSYFIDSDSATLTTWSSEDAQEQLKKVLNFCAVAHSTSKEAWEKSGEFVVTQFLSAALSDIRLSRSIAYLLLDVTRYCNTPKISQDLRRAIAIQAIGSFNHLWFGDTFCYTGRLPNGTLTEFADEYAIERQRRLNIAAFVGDLFAVGTITPHDMCGVITSLAENLQYEIQYWGLHLLLLHAGYTVATPLRTGCLLRAEKAVLARLPQNYTTGFEKYMGRWINEIARLIDRLLNETKKWPTYDAKVKPDWHRRHSVGRDISPETFFGNWEPLP